MSIILNYVREVMKKRWIFIVMLFALILSVFLASCTDSRHKTPGTIKSVIDHIPEYHLAYGGTPNPTLTGYPGDTSKNHDAGQNLAAVVIGGFIIISVYNLILFGIRRTDKTYLCLALLSITGAVWVLISQQYFISTLFPALSRDAIAKIEYICLILALIIYGRFFRSRFKEEFNKYPVIVMEVLSAGIILVILLTESDKYIRIVQVYGLAAFMYFACIIWVTVKAMNRKKNGAEILLATGIIMLLTFANDKSEDVLTSEIVTKLVSLGSLSSKRMLLNDF